MTIRNIVPEKRLYGANGAWWTEAGSNEEKAVMIACISRIIDVQRCIGYRFSLQLHRMRYVHKRLTEFKGSSIFLLFFLGFSELLFQEAFTVTVHLRFVFILTQHCSYIVFVAIIS